MRILQICSARDVGGGERYLADLSNRLAERGHQIFFALAPNAPLAAELHNVAPENISFLRMRNALDVSGVIKLADLARRNEIDVLHAHLGRDYALAALAARRAKKPFVLTRHVLFPLNSLHRFALKNVAGIIAPSKAIADALRRQNLFPPKKISLVHYGIDTARYSSPIAKKPNEHFTVGNIGHLAPIKGHDIFIRAAEIVLPERPHTRFVIVGEDKSRTRENRREIENLIARLNLESKIEMAGWTDDIRPFLENFDIFVSAAREEAFGLVMVEAMSHRLPVIATRSEGATEIIENGTSGVLVDLENPEKMARAILDLADDAELRNRLADAGRARVEDHFSLEKMVAATEEFYHLALRQTA